MGESTRLPSIPAPAQGALVTINIALEGLTLGALRWFVETASRAGVSDDEEIDLDIDNEYPYAPRGIEVYANATVLRRLAGPQ